MADVSPPGAVDPSARPVPRRAPDNLGRIDISSAFRALLNGSHLNANPAHGPVGENDVKIGQQTAMAGHSARQEGHARRHAEFGLGDSDPRSVGGLLDPLWCQLTRQPGPALPVEPASAFAAALPLREELQNLLTGVARRVAWGGDRRKGSARIELSDGVFAGGTLVVHTEERSVSVEIELPSHGVAGHGLEQRIRERLEQRGFAVRVKIE
jgi:hypothetical protein